METAQTDDGDVCEVYEAVLDPFRYTLRKPGSRPIHHGITNARAHVGGCCWKHNTIFCFIWETEPCQLQDHHFMDEIPGVRCEVLSHSEILGGSIQWVQEVQAGFIRSNQTSVSRKSRQKVNCPPRFNLIPSYPITSIFRPPSCRRKVFCRTQNVMVVEYFKYPTWPGAYWGRKRKRPLCCVVGW